MHNEPLWHRKVVPLPMARTILEQYLGARKEGLSVLHSKRWAVYAAESIRFGGSTPYRATNEYREYEGKKYPKMDIGFKGKNREKSVWWNGTSKHANAKTFDQLMKNTLGTARFFGKPKTVDGWMLSALKKYDRKLYADLQRAAKNYENIVGTRPSPIKPRFLEVYRKWLKVDRGRKLFVKGFGKFDIAASVKRLYEQLGTPKEWIFEPIEVTATGYGIHRWRFQSLLKNPNLRRYYLKYKSFWSQNQNRLDELFYESPIQWIADDPDIAPETLLARLTEVRRLQQEQYDLDSAEINSAEPFAHLADAPEINTPHGVLRPVKTPREVMEVGLAMKNCATNYIGSIRNKTSLLLALFDKTGKPIALGEVHYDAHEKRWIWGQRLGPENENLEKSLYEVFQNYPLAGSGVWEQHEEDLIGS